jgi:hypothetical protein
MFPRYLKYAARVCSFDLMIPETERAQPKTPGSQIYQNSQLSLPRYVAVLNFQPKANIDAKLTHPHFL